MPKDKAASARVLHVRAAAAASSILVIFFLSFIHDYKYKALVCKKQAFIWNSSVSL
jgi:hypothetical protein